MSQFFLGIGGQRCGTTWLADYLFAHPQVCSPVIKELHVFDHRFVPDLTVDTPRSLRKRIAEVEGPVKPPRWRRSGASAARPPLSDSAAELLAAQRELLEVVESGDVVELGDRYRAYFERRLRPEHRCFGEVTPAYALLPTEGFQMILGLYPQVRLVFVLRDPVDRFWSALHHRESGRGSSQPPATYLDDERVIRRSSYEATFDVLDPLIEPEQLLVVFFEDLFGPDGSTLRRITDFLDIDPVAGDRVTRVNAAPSAVIPPDIEGQALRLFAPTYRAIEARLDHVPDRWRERMALL